MKLSIIIVSWNVKEKLKTNLEALFQSQVNFDFEVLLVDNNSDDGSVGMVRGAFPQVRIIANQENLGFAKANNQAIKLAQGDFILLLNPDMQVKIKTLQNMITWAENNPRAIVSGCKLIDERGNVIKQVRRFPKFSDQLLITLKVPHVFPWVINKYLNYSFDYNKEARVDSIRGSFFLINREGYQKINNQAPLLDEKYFIWFEEVDFCRQVYKLGGEVWYTPAAECTDYVGQSFGQVKKKKTQQYFSDSMLKYFEKWEKPWQTKILKIAWRIIRIFI